MADNTTLGVSKWDNWKNRPGNDFIHQVQRGRIGLNTGLGNGLTHINKYIYGTHRGRYYLIGADSGVGKTTLTDFMFVLQAYKDAKRVGRKLCIYYCSFEIGRTDKIARWCSYYIFIKYGVRLPSDYILGRITGKLITDDHLEKIKDAYDVIEEMLWDKEINPNGIVRFIDIMMHPTMVFEGIVEGWYEKHGTVLRDPVTEQEKKKGKRGYIRGYVPNAGEEDTMVILLCDHLALANQEQNLDTKGIMDRLSKYAVVLRNLFHTTIVFIQQFSTDLLAANRQMHVKKDLHSIIPTRLDFGDSKATYRDADVVIGAIAPGRDLSEFMGWDLSPGKLGLSLIIACVIKNRYGPSHKIAPLFMDGVTGHAYDLPCPMDLCSDPDEWYDKAKEIDELCQVYSPQSQ